MRRAGIWILGAVAALVVLAVGFTLLRRGPLAPDYTPNGGLSFADGRHGSVILEADGSCPTCHWKVERTRDGGQTWTSSTSDEQPQYPWQAVDVRPSVEARDVVVPGELAWGMRLRGGNTSIVLTRDGGRTWQEAGSPCTQQWFEDAAVAAVSATRAWVLCHGKTKVGSRPSQQPKWLMTTSDAGRTWHRIRARLPIEGQVKTDSLSFGSEGFGLITFFVDRKPLVTRDAGKTWKPVRLPEPTSEVWESHAASGRDAYLLGMVDLDDRRRFTLYATHDGADTWRPARRWYTDIPRTDY